jgi:hypothetical protein
MSLAGDRDEQRARADELAAAMQGPDLPGWAHLPPDDTSWAPRLVHTGGACVMVTLDRQRVYFRAVRPDRLSMYQWTPLEISAAAGAKRSWLVGNFIRRLAAPLLPQHAAAMEVLRREDEAQEAKNATCARLREIIPAAWVDRPWPADVHDVRLSLPGGDPVTGRVRVVDPGRVDLTLDGITAATAERLLRALTVHLRTERPPLLEGYLPVLVPQLPAACLPREELAAIAAAPAMVALHEHGAWVHTHGALTDDPRDAAAWQAWPRLRALLRQAAASGADWVLLDGSVVGPAGSLPVHDG